MKALFALAAILMISQASHSQTLADQLDAVIASEQVGLHSSVLNNNLLNPLPQSDYVMINIDYAPINALKQRVEMGYGVSLVDRGEAHITAITPPEFEVLNQFLSANEINQFAFIEFGLQAINFKPLCVGEAIKTEGANRLTTYYVVIESQELIDFRKELHAAYVARGGHRSHFDPESYWPHITLGFTQQDLHLSDGVFKGENSCVLKIVLTR